MDARRALLKVSAEQLQGFRDFGVGLGTAAQGMGKRGEAFLTQNMSEGNLQNMANARLSPEQMAQMSQHGVQQMGSQFQSSQIFAARGLERSGMGSMGENMQRMAMLAGAGSNNPQAGIGSVLEAAVSKGMDSSKAISMMVENTAAIVQANSAATAAGINTTGTAATLLAGSIDPNQKNQEFAVQRAASAVEAAKTITTDTSVSYAGMVNTSRMSKTTGLGGVESIYASKLSTAEIRGLQQQTPEAAKEALLKMGVNVTGAKGGVQGFLQQALENQTQQMFTGAGSLALGTDKERAALSKKALAGKSWNDLTESEKGMVGKLGVNTGLTGEEFFNTAAGIKNAQNSAAAGKEVEKSMKGEGGSATLKTLDDLRTSGFKQLSEAALQATKNLGGATKALETLSHMSAAYEKFGAQGGEGKFSTAAADSAGTFGKSTIQFKDAVDKFDDIIRRSGISTDPGKDRANTAIGDIKTKSSAAMNQKKGRSQ